MSRVIKSWNQYRITEIQVTFMSLDDLKGECFDYDKSGYTGTREELREEEKHFEDLVEREGVFGYTLERWNPAVNVGWEHVDSCFGFVGQYSESDSTFKHYIVEELEASTRGEE